MLKSTTHSRLGHRSLGVFMVLLFVALFGIAGFANGVAILGATLAAISLSVLAAVFIAELRASPPPLP